MSLRPTGFRVLVKPDPEPDETASGLVLPQDRHRHVPVSGTVVAIGNGSEREYQIRVRAFKEAIDVVEGLSQTFNHPAGLRMACEDLARLLASQKANEPEIHVWDRVCFAANVGMKVAEDGEEFVLLNLDDIDCVVKEEEEAEAVA